MISIHKIHENMSTEIQKYKYTDTGPAGSRWRLLAASPRSELEEIGGLAQPIDETIVFSISSK